MQIKEYIKDKKSTKKSKYLKKIFSSFTGKISIILLYTFFVASIPYSKYVSNVRSFLTNSIPETDRHKIKAIFNYKFALNWIDSFASDNNEFIKLDLKFENYQKLKVKRDEALLSGILISSDNDFVKTSISNQNKKVQASIRLKGDLSDHLKLNKWSYRVKIKDGKTLYGLNKFSLHSPATRNYMWEWLYHELLGYEGLPNLKYKFLPVYLNGQNLGTYALEQHFDKILLESNNFKEGPIIKLSESILWLNRKKSSLLDIPNLYEDDSFYRTEIDLFKEKKILSNNILKNQFFNASQLLEGFYRGELETNQVFDLDLLAKFFAISDLTNTLHGTYWNNQRFYFDPVQTKLIPIGFDGMHDQLKLGSLNELSIDSNYIDLKYFEDINFVKKYISELQKISDKKYLEKFIKDYSKEIKQTRRILSRSYPANNFSLKQLYTNQKIIRNALNPSKALIGYNQENDSKEIVLSLANTQQFPIKIIGVYQGNKQLATSESEIIIKGKRNKEYMNFNDYRFNIKISSNNIPLKLKELSVRYKILGTKNIKSIYLKNYKKYKPSEALNDIARLPANISKFDFIDIDDKNKIIKFKFGNWKLSQNLIIPEGYVVSAGPGFNLELSNNALIYSKSHLNFVGSENENIIIKSSDSGQGIVVLNTQKKSKLINVIFQNLGEPIQNNWTVPGSVTFYQAPVFIDNCSFINNNSEDSLNIVRTNFVLQNTNFLGSFADSIDIDFSNGVVKNIRVLNAGNDGLDISGSDIKAENINFLSIKDKAISAGEKSNIFMKNILIDNAGISVASKDYSEVLIENLDIKDSNIGFASFQKKNEYGPSKIKVNGYKLNNLEKNYLLSAGSEIILNGKFMKINTSNQKINSYVYGK